MFDFSLFKICAGCQRRKFYISRKWIQPMGMPKVRPQNKMCNSCLRGYENVRPLANLKTVEEIVPYLGRKYKLSINYIYDTWEVKIKDIDEKVFYKDTLLESLTQAYQYDTGTLPQE